jgi:predicted ester cyclase
MNPGEYKLFLHRFVEQAWERGNLTAIGQYIAAECIYHDLALARDICGPVELTHYIKEFHTAVRDWQFRVEDVVSEGNSIAMRWIIEGTQESPLAKLQPTGGPIQLIGITLYRLTGSRVTQAWSCWNAQETPVMRRVFCACGMQLEAPDDTALLSSTALTLLEPIQTNPTRMKKSGLSFSAVPTIGMELLKRCANSGMVATSQPGKRLRLRWHARTLDEAIV